MKALLPLLIVLLFSASTISAQETPEVSDWTTEERCITAPSQPPEGWTYDGVIFTFKPGDGVHARRADFPTPYYVAYTGESEFGQSGRFSPDGRWFAVPEGHVEVASMVSYIYFIDAIRVYSTAPAHTSFTVANLQVGLTDSSYFPVDPVSWLDNEHFVANQWKDIHSNEVTPYVFNPFTQEAIPLSESPYRDFVLGTRYGAPTVQKREQNNGTYAYVLVDSDGTASSGTPLPISGAALHWFSGDVVQWTADNTQFAGVLSDDSGIGIFDRDGHLQATIPVEGLLNDFRLAPVGELLAFASREGSLHIANLATRTILDTCIETYFSPMFSPNGRELAFGLNFGGYIYVLDLEAWEAYRIDLAAADVIGWYPLE